MHKFMCPNNALQSPDVSRCSLEVNSVRVNSLMAVNVYQVPSNAIIGAMSSAFNMIQSVRIAQQAAVALGHSAVAANYSAINARLTKAFHNKFYTNDASIYGDGTQPALVYALWLRAAPPALESATVARLLALLHNGTAQCSTTPCLDTGILATKWLMETLSQHNQSGLGLALALKTDYPSWGCVGGLQS